MSNKNNTEPELKKRGRGRRKPRTLKVASVVILVIAAVIFGGIFLLGSGQSIDQNVETWQVRQGRLELSVNESGTLQAERTERIRSRVSQTVTIIELVAEGIRITEEDIRNRKVLARLDSSGLEERLNRQEIAYENSSAALTRARENLSSRESQNQSDIRGAELNVKFARLELEQYLGKHLAEMINEETDFTDLGLNSRLGGSAYQRRIDLETSVRIASEEFERAKDKLEWTERLFERDYVTRNEMLADQLALERTQAQIEQAELALELFLEYDLPKNAESRYENWLDSKLELERIRSDANSRLAQSQADLRNAQATYELEKRQLEDLQTQIENCAIRAERTGLLMYASSADMRARSRYPIEEGASVRERQEIFHLPDISSMIADLKIPESMVTKVRQDQRAQVSIDAYPGLVLNGTVKSVASMPDPQHWLQDTNVYTVIVSIDNPPDYLLPGMTCRAQIITSEIPDAVYIPVHAITSFGSRQIVFVRTDRSNEMREVDTGEADDRYVHITSGLQPGERVMLNPPIHIEDEDEPEDVPVELDQNESEDIPAGSDDAPAAGAEGSLAQPGGQQTPGNRGGPGSGGCRGTGSEMGAGRQ